MLYGGIILIIIAIFMFSLYLMPGGYISGTGGNYINTWGTIFIILGIILTIVGLIYRRRS